MKTKWIAGMLFVLAFELVLVGVARGEFGDERRTNAPATASIKTQSAVEDADVLEFRRLRSLARDSEGRVTRKTATKNLI
jgi:hypothetical protein